MKLTIVSPEKTIFSGTVSSVLLPGAKGNFEVLEDHAPLISSLEEGTIRVKSDDKDIYFDVKSGFVELALNVVTVCVEQ